MSVFTGMMSSVISLEAQAHLQSVQSTLTTLIHKGMYLDPSMFSITIYHIVQQRRSRGLSWRSGAGSLMPFALQRRRSRSVATWHLVPHCAAGV